MNQVFSHKFLKSTHLIKQVESYGIPRYSSLGRGAIPLMLNPSLGGYEWRWSEINPNLIK